MINDDALKKYSVLFVEDEKAIRENYIRYLQRYFSEIYEAKDGEEAYKIYLQKQPDVMIVDINLPFLNGMDLVKKIREEDHSTKIVMLTAQSDTKSLLEATELKLTKYLVKPVSRSELQKALEMVFDEFTKFSVKYKKSLKISDEYSWDYTTSELKCMNEVVILTNKEVEILGLLFSNIEKTFRYQEIILHVWPHTYEDKSDAIKTIIKNIRRKLPKECIKNVFGVGYKAQIE